LIGSESESESESDSDSDSDSDDKEFVKSIKRKGVVHHLFSDGCIYMSKDEPGDAVGTWETDSDGNKTYAFC
jgi:hypothetical protein